MGTRLVQILKTCPTRLQMIANQDLKATQASLSPEVTNPEAQSAVCGAADIVAAGLQSAARGGGQRQRSIFLHPPPSSSFSSSNTFTSFSSFSPNRSFHLLKICLLPHETKKADGCVLGWRPAYAAPPTRGSIHSDIGRYWHVLCSVRRPSFFPHASCLLLLFSYNSLHLPEQIRRQARVFLPCA